MTYIIERCERDDVLRLQDISIRTFDETFRKYNRDEDIDEYIRRAFTVEKLGSEIENKNSQFYFCCENGVTVAYLKLNVNDAQSEVMNDDYLEIERIYILGDYQKNSIGQMLVDYAVDVARSMGKSRIWLGVWENNLKALKFYRKNGFETVGSHSFYMGDDEQTDYIMTKIL